MAYNVEVKLGDHLLESGDVLQGDCVRGRVYGRKGGPVIVIPGGISASRFIADGSDGKDGSAGWWSSIVYPGGAIDLNRFQVLGFDCAPDAQNAADRLTITTKDQARRLAALLDHLGIERVQSIIGMSYGGMIALAFAEQFSQRLESLCIFGAAHRPWPMGVALRGIQRRIIDLAIINDMPLEGLKLARELAMTTYRSAEEFKQRFDVIPSRQKPPSFDVGDYLEARGAYYTQIMQVNRFLALSESIDLHRVDPKRIQVPTTLIAASSDQLAPPSELIAMRDELAGPVQLHIIDSIYGHDSFLKGTMDIAPILARFVEGERYAA